MAGDTPFKNAQGIPMCPKCKHLLPDGPQFCPTCGEPLRGPKMHRRAALGCLMMLVTPAGVFFANRYSKPAPAAPEKGELQLALSDITVQPHTTFYSMIQPVRPGTLVLRVESTADPVGLNCAPVGEDGFTEALDGKMRETATDIEAGKQGEVSLPVEGSRKYGVFIINEGDKPAKVRYRTLFRWGR